MGKTIYPKIKYVEKRKVKEKEYEIFIVPNKFNMLFGEYSILLRKIIKLNDELSKCKSVEEITAVQDKIIEAEPEKVLSMKYDLIRALMIANDYEYDEEWLDNKADPESVNEFIAECAMKDSIADTKKSVSVGKLNYERLIAALNKYWRPVTDKEFWYKMDAEATNNAISVSGFSKEMIDWIWTKDRKPFEVF